MYWKITKDRVANPKYNDTNYTGREFGQRRKGERCERFSLKDCEGNTHYQGIISERAEEEDLQRLVMWGATQSGATQVWMNGRRTI